MSHQTRPSSPPGSPQPAPPHPNWLAALRHSAWVAYALGVVLTLATLLARLGLGFSGGDSPAMIIFTLPIILSAALGGLGPGLAATALAALLTNYFLLPPLSSFSIASVLHAAQWVGLITAGVLISVLCEGLHRARRRAAASQRLQTIMLSSIGDALIATDAHGRISLINAEAERLTGWRNQDALGQPAATIFRMINAQTRAPIADPAEHILRTGAATGPENRAVLLARDGREIPIENSGVPIADANGALAGALLVFRDVSSRLQVEAMQMRLAAIVEFSYDAIVGKDLRGIVTSWNSGAERIFGYAECEMVGQSITRIIPLDRREEEQMILARIRRGERVDHFETVRQRQDGGLVDVSVTVSPIRDSHGQIVGASKIARDITERKRAEVALRRHRDRLQHLHAIDRAILAHDSPIAIAQAAIEHIGLLIPSTRVALVLIDMAAQTMTLVALQRRGEIQHSPNLSAPLTMSGDMLDQLQRGEVYHVANVMALATPPALLHTAQAEHLRAFFITPILAGNQLIATINVGADAPDAFLPEHIEIVREVADQVSIAIQQAQLRAQIERYAQELEQRVAARTAELEATNKELEAFSYSVSHDLRAPLRAIDGFTRILLDEYAAVLPDQAQHYFQLVRGGAQQMGRLIDDLLTFSRLGRQPLNTRSVDMIALVRQCWDDLHLEQADRAIEFHVGALPACQGDPTLLKQVWINLLSNALKYTRRRDPAVIAITSQSSGDQQIYVVKDNGVGFDMRYSDKLFDVFQRLHRAEDYEGTGVGLAIVQRIVHRHGGHIWAEAAIDQGATFYFTIGGR